MKLKLASIIAGLATATLAFAQQGGIGAVKVEPAAVKIGQEVKVTVSADGEAPTFCGMAIDFGDDDVRNVKVAKGEAQFPVTVTKTYAKSGQYAVKAFGKKVTTHLPCNGNAEARLTVEAAAVKTAGPACPAGYKLQGKAGKAGDFTCKAGKGATQPEKVLECPGGLEYFQSKTSLGCAKARK